MVTTKPYEIAEHLLENRLIFGMNYVRAIYSFRDLKSPNQVDALSRQIGQYFSKYLSRALCNTLNIPLAFLYASVLIPISNSNPSTFLGSYIICFVMGFLVSYSIRSIIERHIFNFVRGKYFSNVP